MIWCTMVREDEGWGAAPRLYWDGDTTYVEVRALADRFRLIGDWGMTELGLGGYFTPLLELDFETCRAINDEERMRNFKETK